MKPAQVPRVRLVVKAPEVRIPTAKEPPPPVIYCTQSSPPAVKKPKPDLKALRRLRVQENSQKALELSQQHPPMRPEVAIQIVLGQFTVEDWYARRMEKNENAMSKQQRKRQLRAQQEVIIQSLGGKSEEIAWTQPFIQTGELLWLEVSGQGDIIARFQTMRLYTMTMEAEDSKIFLMEKTLVSAICSAANQSRCVLMRKITGEPSKRNKVPARALSERWSFPHELLQRSVGQQVRVELLNGSIWTGYVRWANAFTFLLEAEPQGGTEVLIFKHACCGLDFSPRPA